MINLIPNEEKKRKVRDFYFRLGVVFLVVLGFSMLMATAAILPAYFLSSVKKNLINTKLATQKAEPVPAIDQETLAAVSDLKNKLNLVESNKNNKYIISEQVINEIILKKMADIKITAISYDKSSAGTNIRVNGTAPSRERLLLFRKALEDDPAFEKVDLPISNFVKGSNIQFSLSLMPYAK